jgi:hypothetical protein
VSFLYGIFRRRLRTKKRFLKGGKMKKKLQKKFNFEGYDKNGGPIIRDENGKKVKETKKPPPLSIDDLVMEVYSINPT